jgi:hypothetical protein
LADRPEDAADAAQFLSRRHTLGYLVRNVAEAADPPAAGSPEQKVWSPAELRGYVEHVHDDRLYALWLLVATTRMRRAANSPGCAAWSSTSTTQSVSPSRALGGLAFQG